MQAYAFPGGKAELNMETNGAGHIHHTTVYDQYIISRHRQHYRNVTRACHIAYHAPRLKHLRVNDIMVGAGNGQDQVHLGQNIIEVLVTSSQHVEPAFGLPVERAGSPPEEFVFLPAGPREKAAASVAREDPH